MIAIDNPYAIAAVLQHCRERVALSWRMPTTKQMEKKPATEAARKPGPSAAAPDAPLLAEYRLYGGNNAPARRLAISIAQREATNGINGGRFHLAPSSIRKKRKPLLFGASFAGLAGARCKPTSDLGYCDDAGQSRCGTRNSAGRPV